MSSLYASLLGPAWVLLDPSVQRLHGGAPAARGIFVVRRGEGRLARLFAALLRMPPAAEAAAVRLAVARGDGDGDEVWSRRFGDCLLRTWQWARAGFLVEAMGPVQCWFTLRAEAGALVFDHVRTTFGARRLALPLPRALAPRIEGRAAAEGTGVRVAVRIFAPIVGLLIAYEGLVAAEDAS